MSQVFSCKNTPNEPIATADDLQKLFANEMPKLLHLALLLTADVDQAQRCLIHAMRECMSCGSVPRGRMRISVRRAVVRNAIRLLTRNQVLGPAVISDAERNPISMNSPQNAMDTFEDSVGILALSDFERLVFVISVLEQYPLLDCALLLGRSQEDVRNAQSWAVIQIAAFEQELCRGTDCSFQQNMN